MFERRNVLAAAELRDYNSYSSQRHSAGAPPAEPYLGVPFADRAARPRRQPECQMCQEPQLDHPVALDRNLCPFCMATALWLENREIMTRKDSWPPCSDS
jgi:hypothetical protein